MTVKIIIELLTEKDQPRVGQYLWSALVATYEENNRKTFVLVCTLFRVYSGFVFFFLVYSQQLSNAAAVAVNRETSTPTKIFVCDFVSKTPLRFFLSLSLAPSFVRPLRPSTRPRVALDERGGRRRVPRDVPAEPRPLPAPDVRVVRAVLVQPGHDRRQHGGRYLRVVPHVEHGQRVVDDERGQRELRAPVRQPAVLHVDRLDERVVLERFEQVRGRLVAQVDVVVQRQPANATRHAGPQSILSIFIGSLRAGPPQRGDGEGSVSTGARENIITYIIVI